LSGDLDAATINFRVKKNRRMLEVPLNDKALAVVRGSYAIRRFDCVFYNPETGGLGERPLARAA
jgi:hypothetical protein